MNTQGFDTFCFWEGQNQGLWNSLVTTRRYNRTL